MIQEEQTPQWSHVPFDSQGKTGETGETVETEVTEDDVECIVETVETVELEIKTESGNVEVSRFQVELTEERSLQKEGKKRQKLEGNRNGSLQPGKIRLQTQNFPRGYDSNENPCEMQTKPRQRGIRR